MADSARLCVLLQTAFRNLLPRCEGFEDDGESECIARDRAWVRALDARVRARARDADRIVRMTSVSARESLIIIDFSSRS